MNNASWCRLTCAKVGYVRIAGLGYEGIDQEKWLNICILLLRRVIL